MNLEKIIETIEKNRHYYSGGTQRKNIYDMLEKKFENKEFNLDELVYFYSCIEDDFEKSLRSALEEFTCKNKVFANAYDKNENKIYVGDNIIYNRRIRSLHPADKPEIKGEMPHGKDDDGNDLYYYTDRIVKLKGTVNYGIDKNGYHTRDYISLRVNGNYKPMNHYIEKTIKVKKQPNGRWLYDNRKIYTDIELISE